MLTYFFLLLLAYFLIRFVIGFVIPFVTAALRIRRKMKEMNQYQQGGSQPNAYNDASQASHSSQKTSVQKDYIDFEEIKE